MEKHYYLYKITNILNNKIYIGTHITTNLNDKYMGSGKLLKYSQNKHGIHNFKKDILQFFDTAEQMYLKESKIVTEDFVNRKDTYNIKIGGKGGFDHINNKGRKRSKKEKKAISIGMKRYIAENPQWLDRIKKVHERNRELGLTKKPPNWTGKKHTKRAKRKIGEKNSKHQKGEGNSQFGTMWIYNDELRQCKKILKTGLIPNGWKKGRKIKF